MPDPTSDQIRGFIEARFPRADINDAQDIFSLGYINSLFAMELVMFLEKTFAIAIPNDELRIDNVRTVGRGGGIAHDDRAADGAGNDRPPVHPGVRGRARRPVRR